MPDSNSLDRADSLVREEADLYIVIIVTITILNMEVQRGITKWVLAVSNIIRRTEILGLTHRN